MSKSNRPTGVAWGEASDELKAKVKLVLQMAQNNRYSVSRIYAAHNAVFSLKEQPETCSTCLTSREKALRKWWAENAQEETVDPAQPIVVDGEPVGKPAAPATPAKVTGVKQTPKGKAAADPKLDTLKAEKARYDKLHELGVTKDSSDEDTLEAYEVLAAAEDNTEDDNAFYAQQIELLTQNIADANVVAFTPEQEGAQYGIATKGGQPLPAGNYDHEGAQYAVSGDQGHYTVITGEPAGDAAKPVAHVIEEGALKLVYTPSAEDASKGAVAWEDGSKVKAGTYTSLAGVNIAVQVGGKASIK